MNKLKVKKSHSVSILRNLTAALIRNGSVTTTLGRGKALKPFAEKIITASKKKGVNSRRKIARDIADREVVRKLFLEIAPKYRNRRGGYTRLIRLDTRLGDGAETCRLELV